MGIEGQLNPRHRYVCLSATMIVPATPSSKQITGSLPHCASLIGQTSRESDHQTDAGDICADGVIQFPWCFHLMSAVQRQKRVLEGASPIGNRLGESVFDKTPDNV